MTNSDSIPVSQLREALDYNPETGELTWKPRAAVDRHTRRWNACHAGRPALTADSGRGYLKGSVYRKGVKAHRVAWALFFGSWPAGEIDHINGNRSDNRIANLRVVTQNENMKNRRPYKKASDLPPGIDRERGKFRARIKFNGVRRHLGYFEKQDDAVAAYRSACRTFGYHENHGR